MTTTIGRTALGILLLAVSTAVTFHAWLGWGDVPRRQPDPLTGSTTASSAGWAMAGFVVTLAVLVVVATWLLPAWVPVLVVPSAVAVVTTLSTSTEDALWAIGVFVLTASTLLATAALTLVTVRVRRSRPGPSVGAPRMEP